MNDSYRYGFNGKENDNDIKGEGNQQDYGMRIYDPRLGRFLSVDPLAYTFPYYSPFQSCGNMPIAAIDLDGLEQFVVIHYKTSKNSDPYKIQIRSIKSGDVLIDQNVQKITKINENESNETDGRKVATNNVLVFEVYNEGTSDEMMLLVDDRANLSKREHDIYHDKNRLDKSGNAEFLYSSSGNHKYQSTNAPTNGRYFIAEQDVATQRINIIRDVPSIYVSDDPSLNGTIAPNNNFNTLLNQSLDGVKNQEYVSQINVQINIFTMTAASKSYLDRDKTKTESLLRRQIQSQTGAKLDKINVNISVTVGAAANSTSSIEIKN